MQLNSIFTDEDAVSPVIGVILMVAITVILAAVIGAFVLGIGGSQEQVPQATMSFDSSTYTDSSGSPSYTQVMVSHDGGDDINANRISVSVGGDNIWDSGAIPGTVSGVSKNTSLHNTNWNSGNTISAGSSLVLDNEDGTGPAISNGETITVVWSSSSGDSSNVIAEGEVAI